MSVVGFSGFTHFRFQRQGQGKKGGANDNSNGSGSVAKIGTSDSHTEPCSSSGSSLSEEDV